MSEYNLDLEAIAAAAAALEDQSETTTGGFELPVVGLRVARLREYIELGMHPQTYNGDPKPPADEVRLVWELMGPSDTDEFEVVAEDGSKSVVKKYKTIAVKLTKKFNEKAGFHKLFATMNSCHGDQYKHIAAMVGKAFVIEVVHGKSKDGQRTYANLKTSEKGWLITPPFKMDAVAGTSTPYEVPALMGEAKVFIWDMAGDHPDMFRALHIPGTRTVKRKDDAGVEQDVQESKNWLQELIVSATNFQGSPLFLTLTENKAAAEVAAQMEAPATVEPVRQETVIEQPEPDAVVEAPVVETVTADPVEVALAPTPEPVVEAPAETAAPLTGVEQMQALGLLT